MVRVKGGAGLAATAYHWPQGRWVGDGPAALGFVSKRRDRQVAVADSRSRPSNDT
jgi:hypothetical protein